MMGMGVPNITRRFNSATYYGAPTVLFRNVNPYAGLTDGWIRTDGGGTEAEDWTNGGYTDARLTTNSGNLAVTKKLFPVTQVAKIMDKEIWPMIETILSQALGATSNLSQGEFIRYLSTVAYIYTEMLAVKNLYDLTMIDYSSIYPYTPEIPDCVENISKEMGIRSFEFEMIWGQTMRRLEQHILFPGVVENIKRLMSPFILGASGGKIAVPITRAGLIDGTGYDTQVGYFDDWLSYLDGALQNAKTYMTAFLPFTLSSQNPWQLRPVAIDPSRETSWYNSGLYSYFAYLKTGVGPDSSDDMYCNATTDQIQYLTSSPEAPWEDMRDASMFEDVTLDGESSYWLKSIHRQNTIRVRDDLGVIEVASGVSPTQWETTFSEHLHNRYWEDSYSGGYKNPAYIQCSVPGEAFEQAVRLQMHLDFGMLEMSQILRVISGMSLRERRMAISSAWNFS
jgi:hypothetical protein